MTEARRDYHGLLLKEGQIAALDEQKEKLKQFIGNSIDRAVIDAFNGPGGDSTP